MSFMCQLFENTCFVAYGVYWGWGECTIWECKSGNIMENLVFKVAHSFALVLVDLSGVELQQLLWTPALGVTCVRQWLVTLGRTGPGSILFLLLCGQGSGVMGGTWPVTNPWWQGEAAVGHGGAGATALCLQACLWCSWLPLPADEVWVVLCVGCGLRARSQGADEASLAPWRAGESPGGHRCSVRFGKEIKSSSPAL